MAQIRCYVASSNTVNPVDSFGPCTASNSSTPIVSCCNTGHTCLSNGFCQYDDVPATGSGIYVGGCTDPTFKDPSCHSFCKNLPMSEAVFANGTWSCCGSANGAPTCNSPAGPTFSDPSPLKLFKIAKVEGSPPSAFSLFPTGMLAVTDVQAGSATGTASPTASPTAASVLGFGTNAYDTSFAPIVGPTASPMSQVGMDGLSNAAIAGIATGCAMAVVITGLLTYLVVLLRRSAQRHARQAELQSSVFTRQKSCSECSSHTPSSTGTASRHDLLSEAKSPRPGPEIRLSGFQMEPVSPRALPAQRPLQELDSPMLRYELRATGSVNEMMAAARIEDRMAGGGPDKALPSLPPVAEHPYSRTERWVRRPESLDRYEFI